MDAEQGEDRIPDVFSIPSRIKLFSKRISLSASGEVDLKRHRFNEAKFGASVRITPDFKIGSVLEVYNRNQGYNDGIIFEYLSSVLFSYLINNHSSINGAIGWNDGYKNPTIFVNYNLKLDDNYSININTNSTDGVFLDFTIKMSSFSLCTFFCNIVRSNNFKAEVGFTVQNDIEDGTPIYTK